ncbi:AAA family ATPase [Arcicella sp. DC2W]|uniref:AAA family ATPase n=1 Tax=Arcicella gelida TaxID=2984195 RepID=A0ABU5S2S7_9BACT|nr:AAA family ATPase [Arcicella sp. DC2W]MEA5402710.1 AAA family ATPase [Arcicella sp. DC2W]
MGQSLTEIAKELKNSTKKVQLIYAFNGTGKTRLSREFKELLAPKETDTEEQKESSIKIMYYNAFTEDLFYWDNDLDTDLIRKLTIRPNGFTNLALGFLKDQGLDSNIVSNFQHYTNQFLTARFSSDFSEVTFSIERGDDQSVNNVKISKGEESNFIWCVFYSLLEQIVEILNVPEPDERATNQFDNLKYVFIDDPVSSLDDTHLIELAVNIAELIKSSTSELKFIITTHNPLFYNVLFNEFNNADSRFGYKPKHCEKKRLEKLSDGTFSLDVQPKDSPFSYHLFLISELEKAIASGNIQKYHYNFLRNILEKTSTFLGYNKWEDLLPQESREAYYRRIINLSSHSKHNGEEISIIDDNDKRVLSFLVSEVKSVYHFNTIVNNSETE